MDILVRDSSEVDLPELVDIYNQSIAGAWSTVDSKAISVSEWLDWYGKHNPEKRPLWVAEINAQIVAWIGLRSFHKGGAAYDATAEVSLYIASAFHKQGIGTFLKQRMIEHCPRLGVTSLVSIHFDHNAATARINQQLGFEQAGYLSEIALVNGEQRGLIVSILRIPPIASSA